ncbi:hypothetical protein [Leeuwenhoekiella sp. MAR_2009_132]|uniref:hypothetical protein n=1 Tax=Leeuwenhoekiella sp. MAR_2009_132 TaxID=1392489 RepID=UPI00048A8429|nr:hypothetical protein [Leeuwenhoekiella sp. MAR_2009_132]|tara:strand:- start:1233 stop:1691 length:459 start_codon:yes stop_codon:yes gene_type:complete
MIKELTMSCLFIFISISTTFSQYQAKTDLKNRGIAKIIENDQVLAKSFREEAVYTIEYLNQLELELKGYASFSFEEKGSTAEKIYKLVSGRFKEKSPQPVSFTTLKGVIRFEYGLSEADSIVVRLAQYNLNKTIEAYSIYLTKANLKQLFDQ